MSSSPQKNLEFFEFDPTEFEEPRRKLSDAEYKSLFDRLAWGEKVNVQDELRIPRDQEKTDLTESQSALEI